MQYIPKQFLQLSGKMQIYENGMELALQFIDLSKDNEDHPYSSTQLCGNDYSVSIKTTFSFLKDDCVAAIAFLKVLSRPALLMAYDTIRQNI